MIKANAANFSVGDKEFGINVQVDVSELFNLSRAFQELSLLQQADVMPRVVNRIGSMVRTRVVDDLNKNTSMTKARVRKALHVREANAGMLEYTIASRDPYTVIKDYKHKPSGAGKMGQGPVTATVWGRVQTYEGSFIGPNGHVFVRTHGDKRLTKRRTLGRLQMREPIRKVYGPAIPVEMTRKAVLDSVEGVVEANFAYRVEYECDRALGRVQQKYKVKGR